MYCAADATVEEGEQEGNLCASTSCWEGGAWCLAALTEKTVQKVQKGDH